MRKPKATVLMPVYNAAPYLREAVNSIVNQSFRDFEFLIFDDGSTDGSREILESYDDPRIRLFCYQENTGYVRHLNRGIELARGEYLFRMDADDIALPQRLERQVAFLDANPGVGLCGSWAETPNTPVRLLRRPCSHEEICLQLLSGTTFIHPTVAMRCSMLRRHGLRYREEYLYAEDYALWVECAKVTRMAIIPEVLLRYRIHDNSVSTRYYQRQMAIVNEFRTTQIEELLGRPLREFEQTWATFSLNYTRLLPMLKIRTLFRNMERANARQGAYSPALLRQYLLDRAAYPLNRLATKDFHWIHLLNALLLGAFFPGIIHRLNIGKKYRRLPGRIFRRLQRLLYKPAIAAGPSSDNVAAAPATHSFLEPAAAAPLKGAGRMQ